MKLSKAQVEFFQFHGYRVVEDLLTRDQVDAVVVEYEHRMVQLVEAWIVAGKLPDDVRDMSFLEKIKAAYLQELDYIQPLDISLPHSGITPETPMYHGPATFRMITAPAILDAVESLIGPEITSNPIQHVRIKPPSAILRQSENRSHITATAWHQDRGVATVDADTTNMLTVWLAISNATKDNGCLRVVSNTQHGSMMPHCLEPQVGIPERFVNEALALPLEVKAGGGILFHPLTIHGAGANVTDSLRWSFDLRYHITGENSGRQHFPEFIARSTKEPGSVVVDPAEWARIWEETRTRLSGVEGLKFNRWDQNAQVCA